MIEAIPNFQTHITGSTVVQLSTLICPSSASVGETMIQLIIDPYVKGIRPILYLEILDNKKQLQTNL